MKIKKLLVISPKNRTVYNFRGDLIKEYTSAGVEVVVVGPNRDDEEKITALGAKLHVIPMKKNGVSPREDIGYLKALKKLIKSEKPDVTFGYTIKPVIYGAIAAKSAGVKRVVSMVTGAGYVFTGKTARAKIIRRIALALYKYGFKKADAVIFQNPDDMEEFCSLKLVQKEKCSVVNGSGVNTEKFVPRPFPENICFFMLSRVMVSKGVREYLEAARKVKALYPETRFMLLGAVENIQDTLNAEYLESYIKDGTVEHFGECENIADYYGECSVYVLPSYREGTPRTVLEAMASRRPVITTDTAGCRETVIDGETGFLVPVGDSDAVAEKMIWFINNGDKIEAMGERSLQYCLERYEVGKVNAEMVKILSENDTF